MKIHDAIIWELIRPDSSGKPTGDIIKIMGTSKIRYRLEHSIRFIDTVYETDKPLVDALFGGVEKRKVIEEMTPDIVVVNLDLPKKGKEICCYRTGN